MLTASLSGLSSPRPVESSITFILNINIFKFIVISTVCEAHDLCYVTSFQKSPYIKRLSLRSLHETYLRSR